jgi:hypothetical protein
MGCKGRELLSCSHWRDRGQGEFAKRGVVLAVGSLLFKISLREVRDVEERLSPWNTGNCTVVWLSTTVVKVPVLS